MLGLEDPDIYQGRIIAKYATLILSEKEGTLDVFENRYHGVFKSSLLRRTGKTTRAIIDAMYCTVHGRNVLIVCQNPAMKDIARITLSRFLIKLELKPLIGPLE